MEKRFRQRIDKRAIIIQFMIDEYAKLQASSSSQKYTYYDVYAQNKNVQDYYANLYNELHETGVFVTTNSRYPTWELFIRNRIA